MAGSTNFKQWNPAQVNQESDTQYASDSQRVGGAPDGTPFPAKTANKLFYQVSTGVTALMQMMANKGFVLNDTNIGTLASVLSVIQTSADIKRPLLVVPWAPNVILDCAHNSAFQVTLNGDMTIGAGGFSPGTVVTLVLIQDNAGGHHVAWPGVVGFQPINGVPGSVSVQQCIFSSVNTGYALNQELLTFAPVQAGTGIGQNPPNAIKIGWSGARLKATVDVTDLGNFVFDQQLNSLISGALGVSGFLKIPLGGAQLIIQWGISNNVATGDNWGSVAVNFPLIFPNRVFSVVASPNNSATGTFGHSGRALAPGIEGLGRTGFILQCQCTDADQSINNPVACWWMAIGF